MTWFNESASPSQIILSLAELELQPVINTSQIILSVESSGYLQTFTRLYT